MSRQHSAQGVAESTRQWPSAHDNCRLTRPNERERERVWTSIDSRWNLSWLKLFHSWPSSCHQQCMRVAEGAWESRRAHDSRQETRPNKSKSLSLQRFQLNLGGLNSLTAYGSRWELTRIGWERTRVAERTQESPKVHVSSTNWTPKIKTNVPRNATEKNQNMSNKRP